MIKIHIVMKTKDLISFVFIHFRKNREGVFDTFLATQTPQGNGMQCRDEKERKTEARQRVQEVSAQRRGELPTLG